MIAQIKDYEGDLKREVWTFSVSVSVGDPIIYFDSFSFETRPTLRHKNWQVQSHWQRLDTRRNNIDCPAIPSYIEQQMRDSFIALIKITPITK